MPFCDNCGSAVEDGLQECPFCGHKLPKKVQIEQEAESGSEVTVTEKAQTTDATISPADLPRINVADVQKTARVSEADSEDEIVFHTPSLYSMGLADNVEQTPSGPVRVMTIIPQRNYFLWLAISVLSLGIGHFFYLYLNLEDLEKHSHYKDEKGAESIDINPAQILIFVIIAVCFLFIPILWWVYYKKYATLYNHLKQQERETAPRKPIHPIISLIPIVISHLASILPAVLGQILSIDVRAELPAIFWSIAAVVILATGVTFLIDYYWQTAFNQHSMIAMKQAGITEKEIKQANTR